LLSKGANPNHANFEGHAPLHIAAGLASIAVARILLDAGNSSWFVVFETFALNNRSIVGAYVGAPSANGATALHYCAIAVASHRENSNAVDAGEVFFVVASFFFFVNSCLCFDRLHYNV
jgi:ankyrin repeat protein